MYSYIHTYKDIIKSKKLEHTYIIYYYFEITVVNLVSESIRGSVEPKKVQNTSLPTPAHASLVVQNAR